MTPGSAGLQPGPSLLRLQGISKAYRTEERTTPVVEDLDLELQRGELTCLVGPSGCGKSTLLALIAGLLDPDRGRVLFDGQDLAPLPDRERSRLRATRIGTVLQSGNLVPFLTAAENVALALRLGGGGASPADLLDQVGLADRADHLPRRLSGGEAQRVGLAVALANDPDLLLADEVAGQLDTPTASLVMAALHQVRLSRGLTVLLVTHSPAVAALGTRTVRFVGRHLEDAA